MVMERRSKDWICKENRYTIAPPSLMQVWELRIMCECVRRRNEKCCTRGQTYGWSKCRACVWMTKSVPTDVDVRWETHQTHTHTYTLQAVPIKHTQTIRRCVLILYCIVCKLLARLYAMPQIVYICRAHSAHTPYQGTLMYNILHADK